MKHTFGKQLMQFALSVDVVDPNICSSVFNLANDYFTGKLKLSHYEVMLDEAEVSKKPGLQTAKVENNCWSSRKRQSSVTIKDENGVYNSQSTFSYDKRKPLWVTAQDDQPLNNVEKIGGSWNYYEQWSRSENLPRFFDKTKSEVKTSIVIPLEYASRVFGFLCLESDEKLDISETKKEELKRIADAIGIILWLSNSCQHRLSCSKTAFNDISYWVKQQRQPTLLSKAKIFVASSDKAENDVMAIIHEVIYQFKNELKEVYWKDILDHGNIPLQILKEISDCNFGICYFSEPHPSGNPDDGFVDNPNVLFEAGMLHALTNSPINHPANWIPIREEKSPPIPFDFGQQRIIKIRRLDGNRLNKDGFKNDLLGSINNICSQNSITLKNTKK